MLGDDDGGQVSFHAGLAEHWLRCCDYLVISYAAFALGPCCCCCHGWAPSWHNELGTKLRLVCACEVTRWSVLPTLLLPSTSKCVLHRCWEGESQCRCSSPICWTGWDIPRTPGIVGYPQTRGIRSGLQWTRIWLKCWQIKQGAGQLWTYRRPINISGAKGVECLRTRVTRNKSNLLQSEVPPVKGNWPTNASHLRRPCPVPQGLWWYLSLVSW